MLAAEAGGDGAFFEGVVDCVAVIVGMLVEGMVSDLKVLVRVSWEDGKGEMGGGSVWLADKGAGHTEV